MMSHLSARQLPGQHQQQQGLYMMKLVSAVGGKGVSDCDSLSTTSNGSDMDGSRGGKSGKRYACEFCPKRFNLLRTYERHIVEKHRTKSYRCRICHQEFRNRQVLKQHCESMHQEERVPCHLCQRTFTTKSSLRLHHDAIHKGIRYQCDYCNKSFGQLGSLRRHVNTIHDGAPVHPASDKKHENGVWEEEQEGNSSTGSSNPVKRLPTAATVRTIIDPRKADAHLYNNANLQHLTNVSNDSKAAAPNCLPPGIFLTHRAPQNFGEKDHNPGMPLQQKSLIPNQKRPSNENSNFTSFSMPRTKRVRVGMDADPLLFDTENHNTANLQVDLKRKGLEKVEVGPSEALAVAILVSMKV